MSEREDRETILEAASSWLDEMEVYIIPISSNAGSEDEAEAYRARAEELEGALNRERARLEGDMSENSTGLDRSDRDGQSGHREHGEM